MCRWRKTPLSHSCTAGISGGVGFRASRAIGKKAGQDSRHHHERQSQGVATGPVQLRHMLLVHAIYRRDECWRQEHDRSEGEDLDDRRLLAADHAERRIEQEADLLRQETGMITQGLDIDRKGPDPVVDSLAGLALRGQ